MSDRDPYERQKRYYERKRRERLEAGELVRNSSTRREPGIRALAIAIIDQAIMDYFTLFRSGAVKAGKPTGNWHSAHATGRSHNGMFPEDIHALLKFLQPHGGADLLLEHVGVDDQNKTSDYIHPGLVWEGILRLEATRTWQTYYGQGQRPDIVDNLEELLEPDAALYTENADSNEIAQSVVA